jgi:hypothetical protein
VALRQIIRAPEQLRGSSIVPSKACPHHHRQLRPLV